jgi:hypothetical protein
MKANWPLVKYGPMRGPFKLVFHVLFHGRTVTSRRKARRVATRSISSAYLSASRKKVTIPGFAIDYITISFLIVNVSKEALVVLYHRGAAIQPSTIRNGNTFVARACILKEDGESTSLGNLGQFASQSCAYEFAVRCATAFVDGAPMPRSPFGGTTALLSQEP